MKTPLRVIDTTPFDDLCEPLEKAVDGLPAILLVGLPEGLYVAALNMGARQAGMLLGTAVRQLSETYKEEFGDEAAAAVIDAASYWVLQEGFSLDLTTQRASSASRPAEAENPRS